MCFKYLGRVECYFVLWFYWLEIFGRYLHHEGGNCQKSYFEVFSRAVSDWSLCKISTLTATPFMFFVHKYLIFDKYLTEIFSLNLWSVFQLSQTASDGFDWNWVKSGPLLFVIFQILNAMDRPIVQWLLQLQGLWRCLSKERGGPAEPWFETNLDNQGLGHSDN